MYAVRRPTQNFCLFSIPEGQAGFEELEGGHQVAAPFLGWFQHHRVQSKKQNWLLNVYICQGGVIIKNKLNRKAKFWFSLKVTRALTSYTVILNLINNWFLIKGYQTWFAILTTCNEKITQPDRSLLILDIRTELQHLTALFSQPVRVIQRSSSSSLPPLWISLFYALILLRSRDCFLPVNKITATVQSAAEVTYIPSP